MTKEELKDKYSAFIAEISEIMGLGKPVDILKLCATTDLFFQPLENRIEELERKLEQTEKDLADYQFNYPTIKELQKENADLKEEINKIAFARGNLEEENAELKEELKKWKDEWQEQVQKATDEGYARTLQTMQLTKAIKIIKTLADDLSMYSGNYQKELLEAKQFLSEVENDRKQKTS